MKSKRSKLPSGGHMGTVSWLPYTYPCKIDREAAVSRCADAGGTATPQFVHLGEGRLNLKTKYESTNLRTRKNETGLVARCAPPFYLLCLGCRSSIILTLIGAGNARPVRFLTSNEGCTVSLIRSRSKTRGWDATSLNVKPTHSVPYRYLNHDA